jgi:two-component system, NarL family, response regulator LiaR
MSHSDNIRVILIDDHAHIHQAAAIVLNQTPDIELVAQGSNGREALELCAEYQPDIVLMDVMMPVMDGIEASKQLLERMPQMKILVLSSFQDDDSVRAMLTNGAIGYILKGELAKDLCNAIRSAHSGQTVMSQPVARMLLNHDRPKHDFDLTAREIEILKRITEGLNNQEIAAKLVISPSTVKFHLTNILRKMRVDTRAEAIVLAAKNDLI